MQGEYSLIDNVSVARILLSLSQSGFFFKIANDSEWICILYNWWRHFEATSFNWIFTELRVRDMNVRVGLVCGMSMP